MKNRIRVLSKYTQAKMIAALCILLFSCIYFNVWLPLVIVVNGVGAALIIFQFLVRKKEPYGEFLIVLTTIYIFIALILVTFLSKPLLHAVAERNHASVMRVLLNIGMDYQVEHMRDSTPISLIEAGANYGSLHVVEELIKEDFPYINVHRALVYSVINQDLPMVKLIIEEGFNPQHRVRSASMELTRVIGVRHHADKEKKHRIIKIAEYLVSVGGRIPEYDKNITISSRALIEELQDGIPNKIRAISYAILTGNVNGVTILMSEVENEEIKKYQEIFFQLTLSRMGEYKNYCETNKCPKFRDSLKNYQMLMEKFK